MHEFEPVCMGSKFLVIFVQERCDPSKSKFSGAIPFHDLKWDKNRVKIVSNHLSKYKVILLKYTLLTYTRFILSYSKQKKFSEVGY